MLSVKKERSVLNVFKAISKKQKCMSRMTTMYMFWFNFILGLIFIFFCFGYDDVWLTHYHSHYHTQKQKKIKIKPRIKLNRNVYKLRVVILQKMVLSTNVSWLNLNVLVFFWTSSLSHPFLLKLFKLLFYLRKIVIFQENVTKMLQKRRAQYTKAKP